MWKTAVFSSTLSAIPALIFEPVRFSRVSIVIASAVSIVVTLESSSTVSSLVVKSRGGVGSLLVLLLKSSVQVWGLV